MIKVAIISTLILVHTVEGAENDSGSPTVGVTDPAAFNQPQQPQQPQPQPQQLQPQPQQPQPQPQQLQPQPQQLQPQPQQQLQPQPQQQLQPQPQQQLQSQPQPIPQTGNNQPMNSRGVKVENSDPYATLNELLERLQAVDRNKCPTREVCYDHDIRQIDQLTKTVSGKSDGRRALDDFKRDLKKYYHRDLFASQYILYDNLSNDGQEMYKKGVILTLPTHFPESGSSSYITSSYRYQSKETTRDTTKNKTPVQKFNQDDVLLYLIQEIDQAQQGYDDRNRSVQNDLRIIADFKRRVSADKNLYELLDGIIKIIDDNQKKEIFDSGAFLEAYLATEYNNQIFTYSSFLRKKYDEQKIVRTYPNSRNIEKRELRLSTSRSKNSNQKNDESGGLADLAIPAVLGAAVGFLMGQGGEEQGKVVQPQQPQPKQPSGQDSYAAPSQRQQQAKPQVTEQPRQQPNRNLAQPKQQDVESWRRPQQFPQQQLQQQQQQQPQPQQQILQQFQQQLQQGGAKTKQQPSYQQGQQQGQQQSQKKDDDGIMGFLSGIFGF